MNRLICKKMWVAFAVLSSLVFGMTAWSEDEAKASSWNDNLKKISVGPEGTLDIGGQLRARYEGWDNFSFADEQTGGYLLTRAMLHMDFRYSDRFQLYLNMKNANLNGKKFANYPRSRAIKSFGFQDAFAKFTFLKTDRHSVDLKFGRSAMSFGQQRLVANSTWGNAKNSFDGVWVNGKFAFSEDSESKATLFWSSPVKRDLYKLSGHEKGSRFYGLHNSNHCNKYDWDVDFYFYGRRRDNAVYDNVTGLEKRYTVGALGSGKFSDVGTTLEFAYQWGKVGTTDLSAWMALVDFDYLFADINMKPLVSLGFDVATGGDNTTKVKTFSQLFASTHRYLGYADAVGRQNIMDLHPSVALDLAENLTGTVAYHHFWRYSKDDAWYGSMGQVMKSASDLGDKKGLGSEIDLLLKYKYDDNWDFMLGYSTFWAAKHVKTQLDHGQIQLAYAQAMFTF